MRASVLMVWAFLAGMMANAAEPTGCTSAREYITALEYLRQARTLGLPEKDARLTAGRVAGHCTGAADRFIRVTETLSRAGMTGADAIRTGLVFSDRGEPETETFLAVFKRAFSEDGLDLDLTSSLRMAMSLSAGFSGDVLAVRDDFETLLRYCVSSKNLDLPRPECGAFAARLAKKGQAWSGGLSRYFVDTFEFLRSEEGPSLVTGQALLVAEELIGAGPDAPRNFLQAYKYATAKKGLDLPRDEALVFARKLAFQGKAE